MDRSTPARARILWLDAVKFVAILSVVLLHLTGIAYQNAWLESSTTHCVALFILVAGMTSYLSNQRHQRTWLQEFWHSSKGVLLAYLPATFLYQATDALLRGEGPVFDLQSYWSNAIAFTMPPATYYVALYLQLMLMSRFLYRCIEGFPARGRLWWEIGAGLLLLLFAAYSVRYTNILGIFGGGGKLLGSTYLFLYYLGMLLMKHSVFAPVSHRRSLLYLAVSTPLLAAWYVMIHLTQRGIDVFFPFGAGYNPPSVAICVFAVLMLFWVYGLATLLEHIPAADRLVAAAGWIGRHTLYIFLYHQHLQFFLLPRLEGIPFFAPVAVALLILVPIAWESAVRAVCRFLRRLQRLDA